MRIVLSLFALIGIAGCPGKAPPDQNSMPPDAPTADAADVTALTLSGKAMDYFGNTAIDGAALQTDGLDPNATATSAADGAYAIDVAVGSVFYVVGAKTDYRPTRNTPVTVADMPLTQDVYLMTVQDVKNQYTSAGVATPAAGTAFMTAELRRNNNTPLEIPLTGVQLLDSNNAVVTAAKGPYAYNAAGNVDATLTAVTAYSGRARIAYLDVPPGTYTLAVSYLNNQNQTMTTNTSVTTVADGATLVLSGGMQGAGGGNTITDPSFAMHIYPKLQRAAAGGLGCANCHTLTGPAAVLKYDDPADTVLANMKAATGVINLTTPADSLLLKRPLYEQPPTPQDHPNATFIDTNDADYKLFLLWITNGAKP